MIEDTTHKLKHLIFKIFLCDGYVIEDTTHKLKYLIFNTLLCDGYVIETELRANFRRTSKTIKMIIDKNINPERDLYYLGGILIDVLQNGDKDVDYFDLYLKMNKRLEISINLYSLTLDWLFILGLVKKGQNGKIKKCF